MQELAEPAHHPYLQFLRLVHERVGGEHLGDLAARRAHPDLTSRHIWAIGRGETLAIAAVESLVAGVADEDLLRHSATSARALSLAAELLMATSDVSIESSAARKVIYSRLRSFFLQLHLLSLHQQGRLTLVPCGAAPAA